MLIRAFLAPFILLALALASGAAQAEARIVSLGSDVTEIVFALGHGKQIVAVDDTSTWPAATAKLPKLGYLRSLAPEPILAQRPTVILAGEAAGPDAVLRQAERAGVQIIRVPEGHSAAGLAAKIRTIAAALNAKPEGERLAAATLARLSPPPASANPPRMLLVLATAPGRVLAAGSGTAGDAFIRMVGGTNAFLAEGYKPLSAEAALAARPEVILVPSHVAGIMGGLAALTRDPVLSRTPAVRNSHIIVVDSLAAMNFGPRLPEAIAALRAKLGELGVR